MDKRWFGAGLTALFALLWLTLPQHTARADAQAAVLIGRVLDAQGAPVAQAEVTLRDADGQVLASTQTQTSGEFILEVTPAALAPDDLQLAIRRPHFAAYAQSLTENTVRLLRGGAAVMLPVIHVERRIEAAFWLAALTFVIVLALIAAGKLHNTLAALMGVAVVLAVSYLGRPLSESLFIFDFQTALGYVDWNVIFLIMGMMIFIAVVERTGIFQWMAFQAYRLSGGKTWLLVPILMLVTGVASAFLDNVTTMLLMTPVSVQIALALGVNPLALLMPEVMASNVVGISTLIGTPTNILIGSYAGLSFNDFLTHLTPGVVVAFIGLVLYSEWVYRHDLRVTTEESMREFLTARLQERARITEPEHLRKAGVVGGGMLLMFIFGEHIHLVPAVTALIGATALMLWIRPDIDEMIEAVDWTTLVFFMALFIVVGAVQEVGLISYIASGIGHLVGSNLILAMFAVTWLSALLSTVIANIPFTAAMLPVVAYLSATIPGADNNVLFFCLSIGAAMGGNGSLIGASANMVTAGIAERAGYPISYLYFLKKGMPALLLTVGLGMLWLLLRFVW